MIFLFVSARDQLFPRKTRSPTHKPKVCCHGSFAGVEAFLSAFEAQPIFVSSSVHRRQGERKERRVKNGDDEKRSKKGKLLWTIEKVWERKGAGEESICVILFKIGENLLLYYLLGCLTAEAVLIDLIIAFC